MMKPRYSKNSGFTLVELIASLILVGLLGAVAGMGIVQMTDGFMFSKKNAETVQKARLVMARLVKELSAVSRSDISAATSTSIIFTRDAVPYNVNWGGNANDPLLIDGDTLADKVKTFSLAYYTAYDSSATIYSSVPPVTPIVEITLELEGADDISVTFMDRVFLRD